MIKKLMSIRFNTKTNTGTICMIVPDFIPSKNSMFLVKLKRKYKPEEEDL